MSVDIENTNQNTNNYYCYICYDVDNIIKSPCKCINLYVHPECLNEWIETKNQVKCTICKNDYDTEQIISRSESSVRLIDNINNFRDSTQIEIISDNIDIENTVIHYEIKLPLIGKIKLTGYGNSNGEIRFLIFKAYLIWISYIIFILGYIFMTGFLITNKVLKSDVSDETYILLVMGYGFISLFSVSLFLVFCKYICKC